MGREYTHIGVGNIHSSQVVDVVFTFAVVDRERKSRQARVNPAFHFDNGGVGTAANGRRIGCDRSTSCEGIDHFLPSSIVSQWRRMRLE